MKKEFKENKNATNVEVAILPILIPLSKTIGKAGPVLEIIGIAAAIIYGTTQIDWKSALSITNNEKKLARDFNKDDNFKFIFMTTAYKKHYIIELRGVPLNLYTYGQLFLPSIYLYSFTMGTTGYYWKGTKRKNFGSLEWRIKENINELKGLKGYEELVKLLDEFYLAANNVHFPIYRLEEGASKFTFIFRKGFIQASASRGMSIFSVVLYISILNEAMNRLGLLKKPN